MPKDLYQILGVSKSASADEIKAAFRKLAHEHHPDKTGGDDKKFKEINGAYQVLGDAEKRKKYDQFGPDFERMGGFPGGQPGGGFDFSQGFGGFGGQQGGVKFDLGDLGDLSDMFGGIFGGSAGGGGPRGPSRGRHIEMDVKLTFSEAVFGTEKEITLHRNVLCETCHGTGAEPGAKIVECGNCGGKGKVLTYQRTILGTMQTVGTCPKCMGEGRIPEKPCHHCSGTGRIKGQRTLTVKVPAGIADGEVLRVSGEGEPGERGARPGDLYLNLRVAADKRFVRNGFDIVSHLEIPINIAALGGNMTVETVDGEVELKLPAGTQPGQLFRLRNKGVPMLKKTGCGDHIVEVSVAVPKKLSRGQKKALEKWDEL
ncbi:MAG: molecular chaperone DnaJ [Patescibacteria group bacterium]|nr:molecular chaperone DnaJ [Patescibacteria group bacterium]